MKDLSPEKLELRRKYPPTYGRRKSRSLTDSQKKMMQEYFSQYSTGTDASDIEKFKKESKNKKVLLEIGFGDGEHLVHQALLNPDALLIGCEIYLNSFVVALQKAKKENVGNIRFFNNDSRYLLERLPAGSLDRVFILFPDPWPKKKQFKRRIVNAQLLDMLYPLLRNNGVIRLATDIDSYFEHMTSIFSADKRFVRHGKAKDISVPDDHIATRYQLKALREGRNPRFLEYVAVK
jgi:tRNA (guanine-N7-)-methyltransferase